MRPVAITLVASSNMSGRMPSYITGKSWKRSVITKLTSSEPGWRVTLPSLTMPPRRKRASSGTLPVATSVGECR